MLALLLAAAAVAPPAAPPPSAPGGVSPPLTIGVVVGGLLFVGLVALGIWLCCRKSGREALLDGFMSSLGAPAEKAQLPQVYLEVNRYPKM